MVSSSGSDVLYSCIPAKFLDSETHGYFGGKIGFVLVFSRGGNQKNPTTRKSFCSSNRVGQESFFPHSCAHNA